MCIIKIKRSSSNTVEYFYSYLCKEVQSRHLSHHCMQKFKKSADRVTFNTNVNFVIKELTIGQISAWLKFMEPVKGEVSDNTSSS